MKDLDTVYDEFFDYLDNNYPSYTTPSLGRVKSRVILASDLLCGIELSGLCDELLDEWLKINYPERHKGSK